MPEAFEHPLFPRSPDAPPRTREIHACLRAGAAAHPGLRFCGEDCALRILDAEELRLLRLQLGALAYRFTEEALRRMRERSRAEGV